MKKDKNKISLESYLKLYRQSIDDPEKFWSKMAKENISWSKPFKKAISFRGNQDAPKWFESGELNITYNCIDRHVESGFGEQVAYYWEGNDGQSEEITYKKLLSEVSKMSNALVKLGVKKGDRVCIYMPMIPEAIYSVLATARIGGVHTVVFAGFSSEALRSRIEDCGARVVITADFVRRGEKTIDLKERVNTVTDIVEHIVMVTKETVDSDKVVSYAKIVANEKNYCEPVATLATDPLFILYTSGSTGKPKGVLHNVGGYLLYSALTHKFAFDLQDGDVYWCAADVGWITGHSYVVYGPLCNKTTSVIYEGVPTYPSAGRTWEIVDKYKVTIYYSTPTLLRSLMAFGDQPVKLHSRKSLRVLGTVGEPINPEVWQWYNDVVGDDRCHIVDTWWQTETGGHAILSFVRDVPNKPGSAMHPFFSIKPEILSDQGEILKGEAEGILVLDGYWPGRLVGLYNNSKRFEDTYLKPYPGYYFTGDGAKRDADGHYWITGRVDDVLNVSGRLIGTAEIESALVLHKNIVEAAVVDEPHKIKGSQIVAFVVPMKNVTDIEIDISALKDLVGKTIGSFAKPDKFIIVEDLPKTRSGKIMRRVLRKMLIGEYDNLGDVSTLANPEILDNIKIKINLH